MLAETINLDILHNHQLIVILMEDSAVNDVSQVLLIAFREEHHCLCVSFGSTVQALSIWIFANAF